jgi:hypothetical protein
VPELIVGEWELQAERVGASESGFVIELRFDSKEQADRWLTGQVDGNKPNRVRSREVTNA